jgi:prophage maintenance system killer protein
VNNKGINKSMNDVVVYQNKDGSISVPIKMVQESVWLSQIDMSKLFNTSTDNIGLHLKNIFITNELAENATTEKFSVVQEEGKRKVKRKIKHYNLDATISVGYRVSSIEATAFRQWATKTLKQHLVKGYTLSENRLKHNAAELENALKLVQRVALLPRNEEFGAGLTDIIARYTSTFLWLQQYDEGLLVEPKGESGGTLTPLNDAKLAIKELKRQLIERGEATALFANEREDGLHSIWGNLDQTVFGELAYPTIESKGSHLLYFVVKNHPFSDGNKRTAAFLFVDFLNRNNRLYNSNYEPVINDTGLAAITLLVAESDPKEKDTIVRLVENLLSAKH